MLSIMVTRKPTGVKASGTIKLTNLSDAVVYVSETPDTLGFSLMQSGCTKMCLDGGVLWLTCEEDEPQEVEVEVGEDGGDLG